MSIEIVLKKLLENNVKLSVKEDKLLCKLPEGGIDNDLLNLLKTHKEELKKIIQEKLRFEKYHTIPKTREKNSYPLTPSQKRLWVLSQFEGGSQAYNMSFVIKLKGELQLPYFEKSFRELIQHHEILRTLFKTDYETQELRQFITPADEIDFSIEQLDFSTDADCHEKVENYLILKNAEAFDLEKAPLFRASLIKVVEKEFVFLLSMHHMISDGWSMEILVSEVVQRYNSLSQKKENAFPLLSIQYKDYAVWLEDEMQKEKYKESEKYWLEKFAGNLTSLHLPSFKKRPFVQTFNGNHLAHTFSEEFTAKIKLFSEDKNVTLFTTLMTVVKALLYRYSGQEDIIVGTPIAGREHPDLENQIGLYINTLAIRTQLNKENTFTDLLQIEKNNLIEANQHQMYSFDELVKNLNLKRDVKRSALFDVMVVHQNQTLLDLGNKKEDADNLSFEKYHLPKKTSQFDLTFNFSEINNQLILDIEYNTDIYDSFLVERIFSHFENFSVKSFEQPETIIGNIDYLTAAEKHQLLSDFNYTNVDYPKEKTIVDLFEEQVKKTPDNVAVVFEDIELTYTELNENANQLAHYLRTNYDVKADDLVGIKLEPSEKMIISILGILKSGGAYVPIDPIYPQDRIEYIEKDSNNKLIIDENEFELFYKSRNKYAALNIDKINSPNDLAYVIYTSGTTGNPKGTLLEHKNVVRLFFTDKPLFDFSEKDVWTMFHSYSFDFSVWEINGALLFGGKLVIVPKLIAKNTPAFLELLDTKSVTVLNQTPSSFYNLINNEKIDEFKYKELRYVIFGGEALNPALLLEWHKKYPKIKLINMYGITETTVHVTFKEIVEKDMLQGQSNIGKPLPTLECYIVNGFKQLVPVGVHGELYVSGLGLARGYLNLPELTAKKFIVNPFRDGDRLYDTGDLACWLPSGDLEYLGRKDQQVKIRGYRIELGDIENTILHYSESLKHAVVDVKENNQEKVLVAYLVSTSDIDKSELRSFLQGKLPEYMIPSYFISLEVLPLTSNGKVNRKELPEVTGKDIILKTYVAPINDLEEQILEIINQITPVNQGKVGVTDNFFEIGLNSLSIVKVAKMIKNDIGIEVSLLDLFQFPNVKMLVENLLNKKEEKSDKFYSNVSEDIDEVVDLF